MSAFLSGAFLFGLAVAGGNSAIVLVFDALVTLCLSELFSANALDTQHSTFGGAWEHFWDGLPRPKWFKNTRPCQRTFAE